MSWISPGGDNTEITLTAEVSKSAIVSHAFADLGERCSFCGDLVERDFVQSFVPDGAEGLQRFWDQEKEYLDLEREFKQWLALDDTEGLQKFEDISILENPESKIRNPVSVFFFC